MLIKTNSLLAKHNSFSKSSFGIKLSEQLFLDFTQLNNNFN